MKKKYKNKNTIPTAANGQKKRNTFTFMLLSMPAELLVNTNI